MGQQILNVKIFGYIRIVHLEFRYMVDHLVFPFYFSFFYQEGQCSGCEGHAVGRDGRKVQHLGAVRISPYRDPYTAIHRAFWRA